MQPRLSQCAELERSLFPSSFSVLLRPERKKTQITRGAFDAERTEAVWCAKEFINSIGRRNTGEK